MDVALLIVNHNDGLKTKACISSLDKGSLAADQIIVINNGDPDPDLETFCNTFPEITFKQTDNKGFSAGINAAARLASAHYLFISNPDMQYNRDCLEILKRHLDSYPDCAMVGPKIVFPDGSLQASARTFPQVRTFFFHRTSFISKLFPNNKYTREYLDGAKDLVNACDVDWLAACSLLVRKEAFEAVRGFDERFFLFMEDVDFSKRLWASGVGSVMFQPAAIAQHELGISDNPTKTIIKHRHESIRAYIRKHFTHIAWPTRQLMLFGAWFREKTLSVRTKEP